MSKHYLLHCPGLLHPSGSDPYTVSPMQTGAAGVSLVQKGEAGKTAECGGGATGVAGVYKCYAAVRLSRVLNLPYGVPSIQLPGTGIGQSDGLPPHLPYCLFGRLAES